MNNLENKGFYRIHPYDNTYYDKESFLHLFKFLYVSFFFIGFLFLTAYLYHYDVVYSINIEVYLIVGIVFPLISIVFFSLFFLDDIVFPLEIKTAVLKKTLLKVAVALITVVLAFVLTYYNVSFWLIVFLYLFLSCLSWSIFFSLKNHLVKRNLKEEAKIITFCLLFCFLFLLLSGSG